MIIFAWYGAPQWTFISFQFLFHILQKIHLGQSTKREKHLKPCQTYLVKRKITWICCSRTSRSFSRNIKLFWPLWNDQRHSSAFHPSSSVLLFVICFQFPVSWSIFFSIQVASFGHGSVAWNIFLFYPSSLILWLNSYCSASILSSSVLLFHFTVTPCIQGLCNDCYSCRSDSFSLPNIRYHQKTCLCIHVFLKSSVIYEERTEVCDILHWISCNSEVFFPSISSSSLLFWTLIVSRWSTQWGLLWQILPLKFSHCADIKLQTTLLANLLVFFFFFFIQIQDLFSSTIAQHWMPSFFLNLLLPIYFHYYLIQLTELVWTGERGLWYARCCL